MINNLFELKSEIIKPLKDIIPNMKKEQFKQSINDIDSNYNFVLNNFFLKNELDDLIVEINQQDWKQVDVTGYEHTENPMNEFAKGSSRCTILNNLFSNKLI